MPAEKPEKVTHDRLRRRTAPGAGAVGDGQAARRGRRRARHRRRRRHRPAIALLFAKAGRTSSSPTSCPTVARKWPRRSGRGRKALAVPTDVMDTDQVCVMIAAADAEFGGIDVRRTTPAAVPSGCCRPVGAVVAAARQPQPDVAATHATLPIMIREGRGGAIVNVSSIEGSRACPNFAVATSLKAAMGTVHLGTLSLEVADHGIQRTPSPPTRRSRPASSPPRLRRQANRKSTSARRRRWKRQRSGASRSAAMPAPTNARRPRCSSPRRCSSYITGTIVAVDGGTWVFVGLGTATARANGYWPKSTKRTTPELGLKTVS